MKLFEKIFQPKQEAKESTKNLHPDFRITNDGFWYSNRNCSMYESEITLKVIFKFEDPILLDKCPFMAKIAMNKSEGSKYFGVAYGNNEKRSELENWAKKFPWAHLILDLDKDGVMIEGAKEIDLKSGV